MPLPKLRRARRALDQKQLEELGLRYVGRYATSRAKLGAYLARKVRERGWDDVGNPDPAAIVERFAALGYIDDAAFALSKARALASSGYGKRRLIDKLYSAGIEEQDGEAARQHADEEAVASALRFAERRKIGPFAFTPNLDKRERERAIASMVRAGHGIALARAIVNLDPKAELDLKNLVDRL